MEKKTKKVETLLLMTARRAPFLPFKTQMLQTFAALTPKWLSTFDEAGSGIMTIAGSPFPTSKP